MQNGELKAFKHAQTIIEYALTTAEARVAYSARMLAKGSPSLHWYQQVEKLRKVLVDKGLVMDDAFWTMPVKPPPALKNIRPALAGTKDMSGGFWEGTGGDMLKTVGILTISGVTLYVVYRLVVAEDKRQDRRKRPRRKRYTKFPGLVGS
jgi:hypothetical protein